MTIRLTGSVTSTGGSYDSPFTMTWSHDSTPRACIIVAIGGESASGDISSVTYGGVAMTQIAKKLSFQLAAVYYLPPSLIPAGTNNVVATFTANAKVTGFAISYLGVGGYRTASIGATGNSSQATAPAMATVPGDMCIFVDGDRAGGVDHSADGGATERGDADGFFTRGFVSELIAAGTSTSMSCSWAGSYSWACTAVPLTPSGTGNQVIWI